MRPSLRTSPRWLPAALVLLSAAVARAGDPAPKAVAKKIDQLALKDIEGKLWSPDDLKGKKAVVVLFLGTQCPINNAYLPRLAELHKKYGEKGVLFLGVNPNHQDTPPAIAKHAKEFKIPFPVLHDPGAKVADHFGARRTPEAFILDATSTVRYQGRIDDQFGLGFQRPTATRHDLAVALDELLDGKQVAQPTTQVAGCLIGRAPKGNADAKITYTKHVAPIIQSRCQECHRRGQIGPMALLTYEHVSAWSEMIREVVTDKRMPPWHAAPGHIKFKNDRSLLKEEHDTLLAWIDQGCAKGDPKDLPAPRQWVEGWYIGKPDVVFELPEEVHVPAKAPPRGVPYKNISVKTNFEKDMWIQAAEAKPGNHGVVHHIIVYVKKPGEAKFNFDDGIGSGFLVAYAPGDLGVFYPKGAAKKVPKGATLVFQMHYTPNGTEQKDRSSVGLVFAKDPPTSEVQTRGIANYFFSIPPGSDSHKVTSSTKVTKDAELWALLPHMHLRGKSFEYQAVYPDGKKEVLLTVPKYDFAWQATYVLQTPLKLPKGTRIECTAHFDNSKGNPWNPDPTRAVRWGQQTWEEMMIGFIDYAYLAEAEKR